jgi:hypothetical protein
MSEQEMKEIAIAYYEKFGYDPPQQMCQGAYQIVVQSEMMKEALDTGIPVDDQSERWGGTAGLPDDAVI